MTQQELLQKQHEYFYSMLTEEERALLTYLPTVSELLHFAVQHYGDREAVSDGQNTYTYRELSYRVAQRRGQLQMLGFEKGDHIAVLAPNTLEAMELYLAIVTAGCVSVMLPAGLPAPAAAGLCKKFAVRGLFYDAALAEVGTNAGVRAYTTDFVDCLPQKEAIPDKDAVCSICLTGGTTGMPKGAVMTHGAMMRGAFNGCFISGGVLYQRYIAVLPLSHIFGLIKGFLSVLYTGGLVFACRDVKQAFGLIPVYKPTTLVLVPGMADIIVGLSKVKGRAYCESLKTIVTGAAPVPPRLMRDIDALGIQVLAGYGLTEGANLTSGNKTPLENPTSMGMLYPEQRCRIVDGELRIKGDNLMQGYFADPEQTAEAFDEEGYLRTGDLAEFDAEGRIYITGRLKNLILLSNGENVSPEALESLFYQHDCVQDCLVKADTVNDRPVIAVEFLPYAPTVAGKTDEEIQQMFELLVETVNRELPSYQQIAKVTVRKEDFPRTPAMKIART